MSLLEMLKDVCLHLGKLFLHPRVYHLLSFSDCLSHKSVPIIHALQDLSLRDVTCTLLALSCSSCVMAA